MVQLSLKYIPVPLNNFVGGKKAHVDLYIRVSEDKYVKVVKRGDPFDVQQLKSYDRHDVDEAWVTETEFPEHVRHCLDLNKVVQKMFQGRSEWQYRSIQGTAEAVFSELRFLQVNKEALDRAQEICSNISEVLTQMGATKLIAELAAVNEDFARHSIAVSAFSVMIAESMGWKSAKTLKLLGMGGMLHDIGMREMPMELLNKRRSEMTPEEVKIYESHPQRGADLLRDFPNLPAEVLAIVYDHHERPGGAGFPRALGKDRIFPMSRTVALADLIAHSVVKTKRDSEVTSFQEAIAHTQLIYQHDFDASYWGALLKLVENA